MLEYFEIDMDRELSTKLIVFTHLDCSEFGANFEEFDSGRLFARA